jgi:hypothetical protein
MEVIRRWVHLVAASFIMHIWFIWFIWFISFMWRQLSHPAAGSEGLDKRARRITGIEQEGRT